MLNQKSGNVHRLFLKSEIAPQKEFSEERDFSSKPVHGKDSSIHLSNSLSIASQNFEYLIWNNSTDCLNLIERPLNADINLVAGGLN